MLLIILVLASSLYEYINMQLEAKRNDTEQSQLLSDRTPQIQHECSKFSAKIKLKELLKLSYAKFSFLQTYPRQQFFPCWFLAWALFIPQIYRICGSGVDSNQILLFF